MNHRKIIFSVLLLIIVVNTIVLINLKLDIYNHHRKDDNPYLISYAADIDPQHVKSYREACIQYADNELVIQPSGSLNETKAKKLAEKNGAELIGFISETGTSQWRFPESRSLEELETLSKDLMNQSEIEYCSINFIEHPACLQQKCPTKEGSSWDGWHYFDKSLAYRAAGADKVYKYLDKMVSPVNIGIIDADFYVHPDLDHMTKDFPVLGENDLAYGHGSMVASVAAAKADNAEGIAGVYPVTDERIKKGYVGDIYCCAAYGGNKEKKLLGTYNLMNELKMIANLLLKKCRVINMSYGLSPGLQNAIYLENLDGTDSIGAYELYHLYYPSKMKESFLKRFIEADYEFLLVQSAGNASYHSWNTVEDDDSEEPYKQINDYNKEGYNIPAEWESAFAYISDLEIKKRIIVVGAARYNQLLNERKIASFSQHSNRVDIMAPGEDVGAISAKDNDCIFVNGTSVAAPFVTGTIANIWSVNPDLTSEEVREILLNSGKNLLVYDDRPHGSEENVSGVPSLDVYEAMKLALRMKGNENPDDRIEEEIKKPVYITVYSQDPNGDILPVNKASITIFDNDGKVYQDDNAEYKDIPLELSETGQEGNYGESSALYLFLPEGNYSVSVSAEGSQSIKIDGLSPSKNSKDSNNQRPEFVEWSFLLKQNINWKEAYRTFILEGEYLEAGQEYFYENDVIDWLEYIDFSLHDMNGDGVPELVVYKAAPMSESLFYVYTCIMDNNKTKVTYIGNIGLRDGDMIVAPDSKYTGIYFAAGNMDYYQGHYYSYIEGKLHDEYVDEIRAYYDGSKTEYEYNQSTDDVDLFHTFSGAFGQYDELDTRLKAMRLKKLIRKKQKEIEDMGWDNYLHIYDYD